MSRASPAAPRVLVRKVAFLTRWRIAPGGRTLNWTFPGGDGGNSVTSFMAAEHMLPDVEAEEGWFEIEKVQAKPWPFWRAVRRAQAPPAGGGR